MHEEVTLLMIWLIIFFISRSYLMHLKAETDTIGSYISEKRLLAAKTQIKTERA